MLGSMFVGLLVGFLAGTLANRGERMGCFGKMFLGLNWCLYRAFAFWDLGTDNSRNRHYSGSTRFHDCLSDFLETRKLIS
ncbi:transglycosylase [Streptococcus pneumoniae]|nr:transglycosylase [Streptococcus pneumoniae]